MFSKSKEPEPVTTPQPQAAAPAAPKRPAARNGVPSIISGDLIVKGTLVSNGDVQIDGKVEGDIRASALVIGEKAIILGDVFAEEAVVRGRVEGSIRARKVQLCATCHVEGNILHEALSVEAGAFFEGNCRHSDNPLADAPDGTISSDRRAAQTGHQSRPAPAAPPPAAAKTGVDDGHRPAANFAPLKN